MARIAAKTLDEKAALISKITGDTYLIGWAYGRPRLEKHLEIGVEDVSPRLPSRELMDWMYAFVSGIRIGYEKGKSDGYKNGYKNGADWDEQGDDDETL